MLEDLFCVRGVLVCKEYQGLSHRFEELKHLGVFDNFFFDVAWLVNRDEDFTGPDHVVDCDYLDFSQDLRVDLIMHQCYLGWRKLSREVAKVEVVIDVWDLSVLVPDWDRSSLG